MDEMVFMEKELRELVANARQEDLASLLREGCRVLVTCRTFVRFGTLAPETRQFLDDMSVSVLAAVEPIAGDQLSALVDAFAQDLIAHLKRGG